MHVRPHTNEHKPLYAGLLALSIAISISSGTLLYINTLGAAAPPEFITLNETNEITFRAHLTDHTPFGRPYLDRTSNHIPMNILSHIDITTNYQAELSSHAHITFLDSATITVVASQNKGGAGSNNNPVILNRTFPLCTDNEYMTTPEVCPDNSGTSTPVHDDITEHSYEHTHHLYLQPYIDFVKSTTGSFADYPISASITIDFQMSASNNDQLRSLMRRSVSFPITDANFQVTITGNENQSNEFYALERTTGEIIALIIFGALTVAGIGAAMFMIKKLLNKKSPYRIELDGYLSDYADAIVKTITPPELENHPEHIAVESFKELMNLAVSTSDPIMYYETPASAVFYIARNSIIYYYIVNNPDFHQRRHRRRRLLDTPVKPTEAATIDETPNEEEKSTREVIKEIYQSEATDIEPAPPQPEESDPDNISPEVLADIAAELATPNEPYARPVDPEPVLKSVESVQEIQATKITIPVEEAQPEPQPEPEPDVETKPKAKKTKAKTKKAKTTKKKK